MAPSLLLEAAPGATAAVEQAVLEPPEATEAAMELQSEAAVNPAALALPAARLASALLHSSSADSLAPCTPAATEADTALARAGSAGQRFAYVTLLTRDAYLPGVQALARSLAAVGAAHPLLVLHTPASLSPAAVAALGGEPECQLLPVERYVPPGRHEPRRYKLDLYWECWTKLRLWELEQFDRLVYLDADMVVLRNVDALFALPPGFYAAPDCSAGRATQAERDACPLFCAHAPHYFNAGMFVAAPSRQQLAQLEALLVAEGGGAAGGVVGAYAEQDLLNAFFKGAWRPLPHTFNAQKGIRRHHPRLWEAHWGEAAVLHITDGKPWQADHPDHKRDPDLVALWWAAFEGRLQPLGPPAVPQPLQPEA